MSRFLFLKKPVPILFVVNSDILCFCLTISMLFIAINTREREKYGTSDVPFVA